MGGDDFVVVLEDDARPVDGIAQVIETEVSALAEMGIKWDWIYFAGNSFDSNLFDDHVEEKPVGGRSQLLYSAHRNQTVGYVISRSGMEKIQHGLSPAHLRA